MLRSPPDTDKVTILKHLLSDQSIRRLTADKHTGGMVALVPTVGDAERLAVAGWEPAGELHVTLAFLGNVEHTPEFREKLTDQVGTASRTLGPVIGATWAACAFNPTGEEPCATYLVGGEHVAEAHSLLQYVLSGLDLGAQHAPWIPHITIGYGLNASVLDQFGPVTFDRLRVAFADSVTDFPLEG